MACNSSSAANHGQRLSKTASACITESVTATHDFELTNYRLLDGMGVGQFVSSSTFSVGGYDWSITFYPGGVNEECAGSASSFLCCLDPVMEVRTVSSFNMLAKKDGEATAKVTSFPVANDTFTPTSPVSGYPMFVEKSKLKTLSDLYNGSFIIRCDLTVVKESRTEVKRKLITVPQPNLQEQLEHLWKDGEGADVAFSVSGQVFNAHGYVLAARSPVFKAELFGPMKEKATQCITIDDIEPPIFEALLHFVYTDCMLEDDEGYREGETAKLQHLLVAADRYGVERLKVMCESKLCETIDVETVASTLVLAEQHHCRDLRQACIEFTASPNMLGPVLATDGFRHLEESCPFIMKDILLEVSRLA